MDDLHNAVATAARFGVFRVEGDQRDARNRAAEQLAGQIRLLKAIDPMLGVYAAYAYADAGLLNQVRSVRDIMRGSLQADIFDVAMQSLTRGACPSRTVRGIPMMGSSAQYPA